MDKRYEHSTHEPEINKQWQEKQIYKQEHHPGPLWSIDTPPPTVSGNLHIGHIFSYTQTDIIARYKRMNGFRVFYPFGFDDNGLPTERYVEKKSKTNAHKLGRSAFIKLCLEQTVEAEQQFKDLWQRMGLSVDWDASYTTISKSTRRLAQASFIDLVKKGYIYRKHEPALYCTACRTSVAQAELDDLQKPSVFYDIVFKDEDGNDVIIGTTRPELLPSCVAVLYHSEDERYADLQGKYAHVPLFDMKVPFIADELVEIEKGTGLVMCCTFGDKTDILWYKKHALPYKQSIGFDGKFTERTDFLAGMKVPQARETIIEKLRERNLVIKEQPLEHAVSVHERCKKEIEFVALAQWFLNILEHKNTFLELAEQINWYPHFMKARYIDWVKNLSWDWCLSRQRVYGIPFPVWHVKGTDDYLLPPVDALPIDPQEATYPGQVPAEYKDKELIPDTDIMDTWNTSSLTPYIVQQLWAGKEVHFDEKNSENFLPMSMRPQAHDIIRTWAFYTIVKTWMHNRQIPWRDIVISGHVLAQSKEKLSKSKGQKAMSPEQLLKQYAADAIRYWTASGNLGHDVTFSEQQLKIANRLITKLWNAFRFAKDHIAQVDPNDIPTSLGTVNEWLLHESSKTFATYQDYLEKHEFGLALNALEPFFWHTFCDNYLELIKDQLFNPEEYRPEAIAATRWTLYQVGLRILQLYAPYMPFITEEIFSIMYKDKVGIDSIHMSKFETVQISYVFDDAAETMHKILTIISAVRKCKSTEQLSLRTELACLHIYTDATTAAELQEHENLIKGATKACEISWVDDHRETDSLQAEGEAWHAHVMCD